MGCVMEGKTKGNTGHINRKFLPLQVIFSRPLIAFDRSQRWQTRNLFEGAAAQWAGMSLAADSNFNLS